MSEKSHVGMETNQCVVCGKEYETGAILLDKRLRASLERRVCTGLGVCDKCKKPGYTFLFEQVGAQLKRAVWIRNEAFEQMGEKTPLNGLARVTTEAMDHLLSLGPQESPQ